MIISALSFFKLHTPQFPEEMCTGLTWKGLLQEVAIDGLVGCAQGILSNEGVVAIVVVGGLVEEQAALGDLTLLVVVHVNDLGLPQGLPIVQPVQRGGWVATHHKLNAMLQAYLGLHQAHHAWRVCGEKQADLEDTESPNGPKRPRKQDGDPTSHPALRRLGEAELPPPTDRREEPPVFSSWDLS